MNSKNISKGLGQGFISNSGLIYMTRCFDCGRENYSMAVASGCCAHCGFDANPKKKNPSTKTRVSKKSL